jgi:hypothetical protein
MQRIGSMRRIAASVGMAALLLTLLAAPAEAKTKSFKAKPSGVKCVAKGIDKSSAKLRCSIPGKRGKAVVLNRDQKPKVKRISSPLKLHKPSVLGSGQSGTFGPFSCDSGEALSCRSGSGHGFTIGEGYQLLF